MILDVRKNESKRGWLIYTSDPTYKPLTSFHHGSYPINMKISIPQGALCWVSASGLTLGVTAIVSLCNAKGYSWEILSGRYRPLDSAMYLLTTVVLGTRPNCPCPLFQLRIMPCLFRARFGASDWLCFAILRRWYQLHNLAHHDTRPSHNPLPATTRESLRTHRIQLRLFITSNTDSICKN